ncbi:hypothetical protein DFA_09370 [Cavenderia fasciculata]|uniref:C2 domain-containing protein n=1 Tax=Cavenderia fasciculata TaxID=261658 RepID=F4Q7F8_CACFS|nr:uncharacterized protein DFA_09370 [Cavenderia fasciculata]EGG16340.1 hypothetical protein DFA_09370 [Cavenderia fasciculata]|eukprot:XP_004354724.1 hypothetical protein DFA_09370 [Cavenderia fasciculata]
MSIYEDILRAQGNMGGKKGPFGYLAAKKKKRPTKEIVYDNWMAYQITIMSAELYKATDSNGLSDPYVRVGKVVSDGLFSKKWVTQTPSISKTLNPVWNYTDEFSVNTGKSSALTVELWDKDALKDDFIGRATLIIPTHLGGSESKTLEIYDPKNSKIINAKVKISIKCTDKLTKDKFNALYSSSSI